MSIRLLLTVLLAACTTGPQATVGGSEPDDHLFLDTGTPDIPEQDTSSDPEVDGDSSASPDTGTTQDPAEDTGLTAFEQCFSQILDPDGGGPDYEPWDPTVASHCSGTDHQDIEGVERVVFLGDSVTVGTPPTDAEDWYRNLLAEQLAEEFDLQAPDWFWQNVNLLDGTS
ncbi:MAG: SGNH/GDSL hydrolase family protein, partial [Myxococcota bacterium]|nr:SGNH/GDSL hydrolase family protein [Myxococcota bacterium]